MKRNIFKTTGWLLGIIAILAFGQSYTAAKQTLPEYGSISGKVIYKGGSVHKLKSVIMDENTCGKHDILDESIVSATDGGLQWAVVSIEGDVPGGIGWSDIKEVPVLDQKGCTFLPHVLVAGVNQPVAIVNQDHTLHNVRTVSMFNDVFSKAQIYFPGGPEPHDTTSFAEAEPVKVVCDVHGWMEAWVYVAETPYAVVTDENGNFTLNNVPPGHYTLDVWHEKLGNQKISVTVKSGETAHAAFTYDSL